MVYTAPTVPYRIIRDVPDERLEALKYEMLTQIENGLRRERTHHERALQLQAESDALRAENAALRDGLDALYELTLSTLHRSHQRSNVSPIHLQAA